MNLDSILNVLLSCDYLILPSCTEGLPFCILESMSVGTPVISSNILGCNEIIIEEKTGFLSKLIGYGEYKYKITNNREIFYGLDKYLGTNISNLRDTILKAYSIEHDKWKEMSQYCIDLVKNYYSYEVSSNNLLKILQNDNSVLIIGNNTNNINYVDFKDNFNPDLDKKYDIIVSIKNNIYNDMNEFLSKLYRIEHECIIINKSYKIVDNEENFIIFQNCCNQENIYKIDSIYEFIIIDRMTDINKFSKFNIMNITKFFHDRFMSHKKSTTHSTMIKSEFCFRFSQSCYPCSSYFIFNRIT